MTELHFNCDGSNPSHFFKESNDEDHYINVKFSFYFKRKCACSMQFQQQCTIEIPDSRFPGLEVSDWCNGRVWKS